MDMERIVEYIKKHTSPDCSDIGIPYWLQDSSSYANLTIEARMVYALLLNAKYPECLKGYDGTSEKLIINEPEETVIAMLGCRKRKAHKIVDELLNVDLIAAA